MRNLAKLRALVSHLQADINEREDISDIQKKVVNRAIWYILIKNYGIRFSDEKARRAYNVYYDMSVSTKPIIRELFYSYFGEDYFNKKEHIKLAQMLEKIQFEYETQDKTA